MKRGVAAAIGGGLFVCGAAACVDLFHGTDFKTLCDDDAAACGASPDAADATDATDAGTGKPPVEFCTYSKAEALAHAQRACAWLGACEQPLGESAFGPCLLRALYMYDCDLNPAMRPQGAVKALWGCLADVASCEEVDRCIFPDVVPTCAAVPAGSFTACGDGKNAPVRIECGRPTPDRATGVEPCTLGGRTCNKANESQAFCSGARGAQCTGSGSCDGTSVVECQTVDTFEIDVGVDCASFGSGKCFTDFANRAACAPLADAGSCAGGLDVTCDGDGGVASTCVDGKSVAIDCAKVGLPCDVTSKPVPAHDPYRACLDFGGIGRCAGADECQGDTLKSCGRGAAFTVSCASVGLGPCAMTDGGLVGACTRK